MKKVFTLLTMGTFVLIGKTTRAQINENFENGLTALTANCWQFSSMMYAINPSSYVINGNASLYSEPPVSADSVRIVRTPLLIVNNSLDVSFTYRLSNNLTGQATRTITLNLTDNNGVVVQNLTNFNVANNATSTTAFSQTFTVNVPGTYRLAISLSGSNGAGSVRLSLDDLYESAAVYGCLLNSPLPVKLTSFQGTRNEEKVSLQWTIATNETADRFEIERSSNGRDFITAGLVMTNERSGQATYSFKESINNEIIYYRLKIVDKTRLNEYSKTLVFRTKSKNEDDVRIINNPATDKLTFSFASPVNQAVTLKVYDINGREQMTEKLKVYQGTNVLSLLLNNSLKPGMYVVEVTDGSTPKTAKFIRQ
jgi:hypothetical protein